MGTNPDGDPDRYVKKWSYTSVIIMMMYLASNSWPEIQFDFHQCARFMHNYRASHEESIIHICCDLKDTPKRGIILIPTKKLRINGYVDSNFSGLL